LTTASPGLQRRALLLVFAKDPRPGEVKTRMSPTLTPAQAADLYASMLEDVLSESARACRALAIEGVVSLHPPDACTSFSARRAPRGFRVVAQRGPNLSARMGNALAEGFAQGANKVILRGSDNPLLGEEQISAILRALEDCDVAVVPDLDGGYGAIGLRRPAPGLFVHVMSTGSVLNDTLANATAMGLTSETLEASFDLDTADDLRRLLDERGSAAAARAPRTIAFIEAAPIAERIAQGR